ncbi:GAS2-like protein 2 isoform X2 [Ambystoma mexicanum]
MFETDDLVLRKNEKNFVLCLLELARRASRFGMSAPVLIQMEEQIEEEIREEMELPPTEEIPIPKPQRKPCDFKNLDQMVQHLVSRCTCPVQFSMIKVSEGKYRVGDSSTLIFVRILRNHVMVRVGGGWDTLEHYLDKHDPCRCTSLSHKQAMKLGGSQKQTAPVHEIRTRLMPKSDSGSKLQTTLIVSRSQSPLPPVDWSTYSTGMPGLKTQTFSPSLEGIERTPGPRTTQEPSDIKRGSTIRSRDRPATPSQRKSLTEERIGSKQIMSPRTGRDLLSSSTSSLGSQLTESEEDGTRSSEVIARTQCRRDTGRNIVTVQKEPSAKGKQLTQTMSQPANLKDTTPQTRIGTQRHYKSQEHSTRASVAITRSLSPTKQLYNSPRQQPKGQQQNLNARSGNVGKNACVPSLRPPSPSKSMTSLSKQNLSPNNQVQESSMSIRPPTPWKGDMGEHQFRNGGKFHKDDTSESNSYQTSQGTCSVESSSLDQTDDRTLNPIPGMTKKVGRPHMEISMNNARCETVWEDESTERENTNSVDHVEGERGYTPLPINPEQEQELYRSLEDEIFSNIKELEGDSDENNLENRLGDFTPDRSIASDTAVHDFSALSSVSSFPSTLKTYGQSGVVPRSGVYINTTWPTEASYDNVVLELSKGHKKLNRVDVENWIAKIPQKGEEGFLTEAKLTISNGTQDISEPLEMERTYTRRKTPSAETKGTKLRRVPSRRARGVSKSISRNEPKSQGTCEDQGNSINLPPQEEDLDKSNPAPIIKPKRSLKKPERVPSIYKLKLRPKIRPRRDNRPEKQPSRIPTPRKYRQEANTSNAKEIKKSLLCNSSSSQAQEPHRSVHRTLVKKVAQSTENLRSDEEAWMSDHSNSPQSKTSENKGDQGRIQPAKADDDEESWV